MVVVIVVVVVVVVVIVVVRSRDGSPINCNRDSLVVRACVVMRSRCESVDNDDRRGTASASGSPPAGTSASEDED